MTEKQRKKSELEQGEILARCIHDIVALGVMNRTYFSGKWIDILLELEKIYIKEE